MMHIVELDGTGETDWDVLVVGRSYAGLSAALTLGRTRRATLVVGEGGPRNAAVAHVHGTLTRDGATPAELVAAAEAELERYETVHLVTERVHAIERIAGGFRARVGPSTVTARAVVLATGVNDDPLPIPGVADHWGRGVFTCPYCDGWEHRDQRLAVVAPPAFGPHLARILTMVTGDVVLCADVDDAEAAALPPGVTVERREVVRVVGDGTRVTALDLADGSRLDVGAVFGAGVPRPASGLAVGLGCDVDPDGFVVVGPDQATSVPGVWAVGDVTAQRQFSIACAMAQGVLGVVSLNHALLALGAPATTAA
jgi:thioredoxin reductase